MASIDQVARTDYSDEQIRVWIEAISNLDRWKEAIEDETIWCALINGQLVGFISLKGSDYLNYLYVHPAHQRKKIAKRLMLALVTELRNIGKEFLFADVSETAKAFFTACGFETMQRNEKNLNGVDIHNYRMKLELSESNKTISEWEFVKRIY